MQIVVDAVRHENEEAHPLFFAMRVAFFVFATLVLYWVIHAGIERFGHRAIAAENGPLEIAQVVLALVGAGFLMLAAKVSPIGQSGMGVSALLLCFAAAREMDSLLERWFFEDAYTWMVGIPLASQAVALLWRRRHFLLVDLKWMSQIPSATLFVVAGIFLCSVCQFLDRPGVWGEGAFPLDESHPSYPVKLAIEESCELFAYTLLAYAGFDGYLVARRARAAVRRRTAAAW